MKASADTVGRYGIYELTLENQQPYANPWEDVDIETVFTAPSGKLYKVGDEWASYARMGFSSRLARA